MNDWLGFDKAYPSAFLVELGNWLCVPERMCRDVSLRLLTAEREALEDLA